MEYSSSGNFLTLQSGFFRTIDQIADRFGIFSSRLQPEDLINRAQRRARLADFGEWHFREPFGVLLKAYEEEAKLSTFGRMAVRWDMLRYLSNLLRLRDEEKNCPAIIDEPIDQPIFILGLPRSGTTFLHNLLAQDPANLVARAWQTIYPYPVPGRIARLADRRPKIVARQFASFVRLAPELSTLHPLDANAAQECIEITGQVMQSLRFDTTHYVPSYQRWLDEAGHLEAYRFHKRFLQHLQHQAGGGTWILKSPDHIFALDALLEVYPDARLVFVHRDPMRVLASLARLTEVLRAPFSREIDRFQIGRQVTDRWAEGSRLLVEASERFRSFPERIFHVHYKDLVGDPLASVSAIYRHFGRVLSKRAEAILRQSIEERPNGGYGQNHYHLEDYGIDSAAERQRHRAFILQFRIEPERDAAPPRPWSKLRMAG